MEGFSWNVDEQLSEKRDEERSSVQTLLKQELLGVSSLL